MSKTTGNKITDKADKLKIFNDYTNNIFSDSIPPNISKSLEPNEPKMTLIKHILERLTNDYYKKSQLNLGKYPIEPIHLIRANVPGTRVQKKKKAVKPLNKQTHITEYYPRSSKLLVSVNPDTPELSKNYPDIFRILDRLNKFAPNEIEENIEKIDTEYSIVINIGIFDEDHKIISKYNSDKVLFFSDIRYQSGKNTENKLSPIYVLEHTNPTKSSFILNEETIKQILPEFNFDKSQIKDTSKDIPDLVEVDKPTVLEVDDTTPIVVDDTTPVVVEVDDTLPSDTESQTMSGSVKDVTREYKEKSGGLTDSGKRTEESVYKEQDILKPNPYDSNQFLRIISFKELPHKTYLQGRAKYDTKDTSYNIYEDNEENKLVGCLSYVKEGVNVKVNLKWCKNYNPN